MINFNCGEAKGFFWGNFCSYFTRKGRKKDFIRNVGYVGHFNYEGG